MRAADDLEGDVAAAAAKLAEDIRKDVLAAVRRSEIARLKARLAVLEAEEASQG